MMREVKLDGAWSIIYDVKNMEIHFKTASNKKIKYIDMKMFEYNCDSESMVYDLQEENEGGIAFRFKKFNSEINREKMASAFEKSNLYLPDTILTQFYRYHQTCRCGIK